MRQMSSLLRLTDGNTWVQEQALDKQGVRFEALNTLHTLRGLSPKMSGQIPRLVAKVPQ